MNVSQTAALSKYLEEVLRGVRLKNPGIRFQDLVGPFIGSMFAAVSGGVSVENCVIKINQALEKVDVPNKGTLNLLLESEFKDAICAHKSALISLRRALLKREELNEEMFNAVGAIQNLVIVQHSLLRDFYPGRAMDMVSLELLGNRMVRQELGPVIQSRIYDHLDDIIEGFLEADQWVVSWRKYYSKEGLDLESTCLFLDELENSVKV